LGECERDDPLEEIGLGAHQFAAHLLDLFVAAPTGRRWPAT